MANAGTHPRVLGYLGRALSLELSAVQQYMTQASLVELWGLAEAAERFRHETVEEMQHAERIVKQMLALGVAPAASQLRPVTHAADLEGLLRHNSVLEQDLIHHYDDALRLFSGPPGGRTAPWRGADAVAAPAERGILPC